MLIYPKTNPAPVAPTGGMVRSGNVGHSPRDRHIGLMATVVKEPHRSCVGTTKDTNRPIARVKLWTGNKVTMIDEEKLYRVSYLYIISFSFC